MKLHNEHLNISWDLSKILNDHRVDVSLEEIRDIYNHHSKFYHNFNHVKALLETIRIDDDALILAIIFHDIAFSVDEEHHEEASACYFMKHCHDDVKFKDKVVKIIRSTEFVSKPISALEKEIVRVDREILYKKDINSLLNWENNIFKEYQKLSILAYKAGRTIFLEKAYAETKNETLLELRDIVDKKIYKIGFYPGSFNPFHIGHYNILRKAEKSFDKVVIGIGVNYDKKDLVRESTPDIINNREIIPYSGLITTEIQKLSLEGEVFVVRGLRNAYDLQHEEGLRNVIKDFLPEQQFVYYFCDKEYEHISSSLIRDIQSRGSENGMTEKMINRYTFK